MCSKLTPRARIPDNRIPQFMQPCRRQSTKFLISMVILNFNVLRLRCFYWMCLMKIAIALKKRSQIGTNKCKGHFTNIS